MVQNFWQGFADGFYLYHVPSVLNTVFFEISASCYGLVIMKLYLLGEIKYFRTGLWPIVLFTSFYELSRSFTSYMFDYSVIYNKVTYLKYSGIIYTGLCLMVVYAIDATVKMFIVHILMFGVFAGLGWGVLNALLIKYTAFSMSRFRLKYHDTMIYLGRSATMLFFYRYYYTIYNQYDSPIEILGYMSMCCGQVIITCGLLGIARCQKKNENKCMKCCAYCIRDEEENVTSGCCLFCRPLHQPADESHEEVDLRNFPQDIRVHESLLARTEQEVKLSPSPLPGPSSQLDDDPQPSCSRMGDEPSPTGSLTHSSDPIEMKARRALQARVKKRRNQSGADTSSGSLANIPEMENPKKDIVSPETEETNAPEIVLSQDPHIPDTNTKPIKKGFVARPSTRCTLERVSTSAQSTKSQSSSGVGPSSAGLTTHSSEQFSSFRDESYTTLTDDSVPTFSTLTGEPVHSYGRTSKSSSTPDDTGDITNAPSLPVDSRHSDEVVDQATQTVALLTFTYCQALSSYVSINTKWTFCNIHFWGILIARSWISACTTLYPILLPYFYVRLNKVIYMDMFEDDDEHENIVSTTLPTIAQTNESINEFNAVPDHDTTLKYDYIWFIQCMAVFWVICPFFMFKFNPCKLGNVFLMAIAMILAGSALFLDFHDRFETPEYSSIAIGAGQCLIVYAEERIYEQIFKRGPMSEIMKVLEFFTVLLRFIILVILIEIPVSLPTYIMILAAGNVTCATIFGIISII